MWYFENRCVFSSRSRVSCIVSEHQIRQDPSTHVGRIGPQTATNAGPLRQQHSHRNFEWQREKTTFTLNGNTNFLGDGPGQERGLRLAVAPRPRKLDRLLHKTLRHQAPPRSTHMVLAGGEIDAAVATGSSTQCYARVCWKPARWLHEDRSSAKG